MKKLLAKDKSLRCNIKSKEIEKLILKSIFQNSTFFRLIRWNAFLKLKTLSKTSSKVSVINRCVSSINKKRLNKFTTYSRHIFLKLARSGSISGIRKSSW